MFFARSFIVLGLTFRCLIHFELIYIYGVRYIIHPCSFTCGYLVFSQCLFVEETVLAALNGLGIFNKSHLTIYVWVYFWFLSIPLVCVSAFTLAPLCFEYYSFVRSFEVKKYEI